jgi:hypothetical protein
MTNIARWAILKIPLKLIILMTNEALKLMQSKRDCGPIIPMYVLISITWNKPIIDTDTTL